MALTDKQQRFCDKYLECGNATEAALFAGYSEKTAYSIGNENLKKPEIDQYLSERRNATAEKLDISRERVLAEYAKIAFGDIENLFDSDGSLMPLHDIQPEHRAVIASVKSYEEKAAIGEETIVQGVIREVKQWDKLKALEGICKMQGYNAPEQIDVNGVILVKRPKRDGN